jgi:TolB-like protein
MKPLRLALALLAGLGLSACTELVSGGPATSSVTTGSAPPSGREIGRVTYAAVDRLLAGAPAVGPGTPLVVATFTEARQIETSAPFGHMVADLVRTRLTQQGMAVSEMRLRSNVRLHPEQGDLVLGRTPGQLVRAPAAAAVVTGTYAAGASMVYVSVRMIGATDGRILAAVDFAVPRFPDADALLRVPERPRRIRQAAIAAAPEE